MKEIFHIDDVKSFAEKLITFIKYKEKVTAQVVTFSGDLGVGKTTLAKHIGRILGVKDNMTSPTFVIMKKYKTSDKTFKNLIHIDAYRLNQSSELINLGWDDILEDRSNLVIVEWPERVLECVEKADFKVQLRHIDEDKRSFEIVL